MWQTIIHIRTKEFVCSKLVRSPVRELDFSLYVEMVTPH